MRGRACRQGFGHVVAVNQQLVRILAARRGAAVDMDNAALRVTLDVIGRVGFGKDFGATASLDDSHANAAFDLMGAGEPHAVSAAHTGCAVCAPTPVLGGCRARRGHQALEQRVPQIPLLPAGEIRWPVARFERFERDMQDTSPECSMARRCGGVGAIWQSSGR